MEAVGMVTSATCGCCGCWGNGEGETDEGKFCSNTVPVSRRLSRSSEVRLRGRRRHSQTVEHMPSARSTNKDPTITADVRMSSSSAEFGKDGKNDDYNLPPPETFENI